MARNGEGAVLVFPVCGFLTGERKGLRFALREKDEGRKTSSRPGGGGGREGTSRAFSGQEGGNGQRFVMSRFRGEKEEEGC